MDTDENGTPERRAAGASDNPGSTPRRAMPNDGGQPPASPFDPPANDLTTVSQRTRARNGHAAKEEPPHYPGPPENVADAGVPDAVDDATAVHDPDQMATQAVSTGGEPGRLLGDRYELGDVIGRGGMAEVRRAYDTRLGRWVAVKELRPDLASDPIFQARFRREAQSAAGLNHPTIVAVYDTGEEHDPVSRLDIPYIVMELVEGHTLRDILKDGRKILPERALELTRGVLDALSYSHKAGIIHRDIKPANVMLTPQGNVKVMDFGIARAISDTSTSMTQTAAVIGTAQYLSPEQARGETVDARSDIYSAGCLLYELLIGRPPFVGDSPVSVAYQHVRELPVPPSQLDDQIPADIDAIVLTALAKDPADRYQSARAMSDDIGRLLAGEEVAAVTPASASSAPEPTQVVTTAVVEEEIEPEEEPRRRRVLPMVLAALALVLVGLLVAGFVWFNRPTEPQGPPQIAVPAVVGQQRAAAETEIRTARLVPQVREVEGADDATIGTVTGQNPVGGAMLEVGKTVQLEVNVGPRKAAIPAGLVGKSASEAERELKAAGFENIRRTNASEEPPEARKDTVLGVNPSEGQNVSLTSEITLQVATGRSPVPNWTGWNQASVDQDRRTKGFTNVDFETRETNNPSQVGTVISTNPTAGTEVDRTDRILVLIGRAAPRPSPTPAPTTTQTQPSTTPEPTPLGDGPTPTPSSSPTPQ